MIKYLVLIYVIPLMFVSHFSVLSKKEKEIYPEFYSIYSRFIYEGQKRGVDLSTYGVSIKKTTDSLSQGNLKGDTTLGHCKVLLFTRPNILIDETYWNKMNLVQKEMVLFHELAHGLLLKGHTNTENKNKKSLMNQYIFLEKTYAENREYYLDELFNYKMYHVRDYVDTFFFQGSIYSFSKKIEGIKLLRRF